MAKVIYAVPPIKDVTGFPTIGQSRQYQVFKDPTFIYPIVPALCMTMLLKANHQVLWLDAVAEEMTEAEFARTILQANPDYIVFECPTPVYNRYCEIIAGFKENGLNFKTILCGEHVSAFPELKDCPADRIVRGGKWHKDVYTLINGKEWEGAIPHIDRNISRWWLYGYRNGNFKCIPATYIMSAMDCWHGKCTFCAWGEYHKECEIRQVEDVLDEIGELVQMGFKEIFDDSGTFPVGDWLIKFCEGMVERGYDKHISLGCNMRFGALRPEDFTLMQKAGFRMILWGLESVNQKTLDKLNKGVDIKSISRDLLLAHAAKLDSHLTVMFGFPWESKDESDRTYDMVKYWLRKGIVFSAQATICIPYPITPLWKECKEKGWLLTENWDDYDMSKPVMGSPVKPEDLFAYKKGIYNMAYNPEFMLRKLFSIRSWDDLKYYFRIARKIYDRHGSFFEVGKIAQ